MRFVRVMEHAAARSAGDTMDAVHCTYCRQAFPIIPTGADPHRRSVRERNQDLERAQVRRDEHEAICGLNPDRRSRDTGGEGER